MLVIRKCFVPQLYMLRRGISGGQPLNIFTSFIRTGGSPSHRVKCKRIQGLSQITWRICRGPFGEEKSHKIEKFLLNERLECGSTRTFESRHKFVQSQDQIQTLKECLCCHIHCAFSLGRILGKVLGASRAVSKR